MGDFNASPEAALVASIGNMGNVDVSSDATVAASMGEMGGGRHHIKRRIMYHPQRQGQSQRQQGGKRYGVTVRKKNRRSRMSRKHYKRRRSRCKR